MRLELYVARHGETDWNKERRLQGSVDVALNSTGEAQARELASKLAHLAFDHLYVSALKRAQQTAAAFPQHIPRTVLADLNERRLGVFEGAQLHGMDTQALASYRARKFDWDDMLGTGESLRMHQTRVRRAVQTIRERHRNGIVLIVAHGATNALMLSDLQGRHPSDVADLHIDNGSVYRAVLDALGTLHELVRF
jgi:2,3-bisphosphoglycerate-dependent phosphoglycerate mutase